MPPPETAVNQHQSTGASPSPHDSPGRTPWLTLLLLLASGTIIRFLYLTRKAFWFDESFSVEVARISWGNFLHLLWWREANMSLYYVLLRIWLQFGYSEFYIRSLSVVISAATIPAIYWLARLLYDRRVALIAAALFTFSAYSIRYSQEARSYALFLLLATLSSGFLIALVREPVRRNRVGYVLISILAVYAHFYALLLLAAHWLSLRWLGSGESSTDGTTAIRSIAARLDHDWRRRASCARLRGQDWCRTDSLDSEARLPRSLRFLREPGREQPVASAGCQHGRLHCGSGSVGQVALDARPDLGNVALSVSASVAVVPGSADGSPVVRASCFSGALYDLLPAGAVDSGRRRPGAAAAIVAADGGSNGHPVVQHAGNILRLRKRLRHRAGCLWRSGSVHSRPGTARRCGRVPHRCDSRSLRICPLTAHRRETRPAPVSSLRSARRFSSPITERGSTTETSRASRQPIFCARPCLAIREFGSC